MITIDRCPLCSSPTDDAPTVKWPSAPDPQALIKAWEQLGEPGAVTLSQALWVAYCTGEPNPAWVFPPHVLFGTRPAAPNEPTFDDGAPIDHVHANSSPAGGYWMRAGALDRINRRLRGELLTLLSGADEPLAQGELANRIRTRLADLEADHD